jgi:signal transduction histidine kinase
LGLAIARGIANALHGRIWLESPGFNEKTFPGTTVFVRLPVNGHFNESN